MGDPNASIPTPQPVYTRPMFGAYGRSLENSAVSFVSHAAKQANIRQTLGLPAELFRRIPFPGPALSARVIGAVTPERIETVRKATTVVESLLNDQNAFQYMAILHEDRVTGMRDGKRDFGQQIEVRCWDSVDARVATPTRLSFELLEKVAAEIIQQVPGIVSVTYNIATKPPSTIEAV